MTVNFPAKNGLLEHGRLNNDVFRYTPHYFLTLFFSTLHLVPLVTPPSDALTFPPLTATPLATGARHPGTCWGKSEGLSPPPHCHRHVLPFLKAELGRKKKTREKNTSGARVALIESSAQVLVAGGWAEQYGGRQRHFSPARPNMAAQRVVPLGPPRLTNPELIFMEK
ncbi:hypothetical protein E2C01_052067 [Portunus trituberculatus]|uniref:Uncharacterized protein n=1 Tax=Portunus trituberculatus TaxID=210409 RepID=A0A5B7GGK8_PORTR|nr:hypothetical protein [Portunus trituberculatus]